MFIATVVFATLFVISLIIAYAGPQNGNYFKVLVTVKILGKNPFGKMWLVILPNYLVLQSALVQERNRMVWETRHCQTLQDHQHHLQPMVRCSHGTVFGFQTSFDLLGIPLQFTQTLQHWKLKVSNASHSYCCKLFCVVEWDKKTSLMLIPVACPLNPISPLSLIVSLKNITQRISFPLTHC